MTPKRKTIFDALLGFAVVAALFWGLIALGGYLISTFRGLNANVAAAIVAAFATVIVSVLTVIVGKQIEAAALLKKEHREKKIPVYEEFIQFWFKYVFAVHLGENPLTEQEVARFLANYTQRVMVWGSDEVIAAWVKIRYSSMGTGSSVYSGSVLEDYEKLILAMRRDLGHKNKAFPKGDVLRLFVNDLEPDGKQAT